MKKIFCLALVIRLICLYLFRNVTNYDLQSYLQIGKLTFSGVNIYPDVAYLRHPYLPFFLYIEVFAYYLNKFNINPIIFIKFITIIFDLGNLYFVYLLSKKNFKSTFLYAVNPVTIFITTLHGQFDVIPIFFLLWSIYLTGFKKEILSILIFSVAVMIKTWPLLFIAGFYKRLKNKYLILLIITFPIVSVFIYSILFKSSIISIVKTIASYQGLWGIWGIWALVGKWRLRWQKLSTLIFLTGLFIYSYRNKKRNFVEENLKTLFFFFVFTPNFSIQYFAWIIPFLIIRKSKKYLLLILFVTLTLISYYINSNRLIFVQQTFQFITWIIFVYSLKVSEPIEAKD